MSATRFVWVVGILPAGDMILRSSNQQASSDPPVLYVPPLEATRQLLDVSVTERGEFRTCRRRWYLTTIENLQAKHETETAFEFGTMIHAALEHLYTTPGPRTEEQEINALLELDKWRDRMKDAAETQEEWEEALDLYDVGESMLEGYFQYEDVSRVQLGKPLAVEGRVIEDLPVARPKDYPESANVLRHPSGRMMVPIVHPDTKETLYITHRIKQKSPSSDKHGSGPVQAFLTARIDLLTERQTPKWGIWVTDHKSAGQAPSDKGLDYDDQVTGYCYVVWRWTGHIPRGVIYNVLIKNAPKDPRMVQSKKKSEGLVLSTAKDQLTTPTLYREALIREGLMVGGQIISDKHAECMNALLARGWDPFFRRYEIGRNLDQLLSFERRLYSEYHDMLDARFGDESLLYPNPHTLLCPRCPVRDICLAIEDGSDYEDIVENRYIVGPDRKAKRL